MALRELSDFLDIPSLRVTGYRKQQDRVEIIVELKANSAVCPECGVRSTRKHSEKAIPMRDLPCFGRQLYLLLPRRRFKCNHCCKPFTERLSFVDFGMSFTKRYEQYIYDQCKERSFTAVEKQEGISDTVIAKVYESFSTAQMQRGGSLRQRPGKSGGA